MYEQVGFIERLTHFRDDLMTFTSLYFKGGVGDAGGCVGFAASVVVFWPLNPPGASIPSQSEFRMEIKQGRDASERQGVASFVCLAGAEVEGSAKAVDVPSPSVSPRDSRLCAGGWATSRRFFRQFPPLPFIGFRTKAFIGSRTKALRVRKPSPTP